nr:hypothetical protein [Deltaproteobacteria bacterium]
MIRAAIIKDLGLLLRDRGALISLFALPVIFMLAFGSMFRFGPDRGERREVAVWFDPGDARGTAITAALADAPGFAGVPLPTADAVR